MAKKVKARWIGIDVSKAELSIAVYASTEAPTLANTPEAIAEWLATLPANSVLAVEATNTYHLEVLVQAHRRALTGHVVDGYRLNRYREGVGGRAKTDRSDAALLARYLAHEHTALRPWTPPAGGSRTLQRLLHRRRHFDSGPHGARPKPRGAARTQSTGRGALCPDQDHGQGVAQNEASGASRQRMGA